MGYSSQTHAIISFVEAHVKAEKFDYKELERQTGFFSCTYKGFI